MKRVLYHTYVLLRADGEIEQIKLPQYYFTVSDLQTRRPQSVIFHLVPKNYVAYAYKPDGSFTTKAQGAILWHKNDWHMIDHMPVDGNDAYKLWKSVNEKGEVK